MALLVNFLCVRFMGCSSYFGNARDSVFEDERTIFYLNLNSSCSVFFREEFLLSLLDLDEILFLVESCEDGKVLQRS